ncbi:MAG: glycosyltransferase [Bacteroidota bacterium]
MKILQILQKPQLRGAELFAAQLAQKLTENGHQVAILFLFPGEDLLPFKGLKIHLHADPKKRLWDVMAWRRLAKIIRSFEPDIVQANAGDTLKYASLSKSFFGWKGKLVFRNANLISEFIDSNPKRYFYRFLLNQVDGVASVSQVCKEDFQKLFHWNKPIAYLPIGTDFSRKEHPLPPDLSEKLKGRPFLLHIGSFVPEKNHGGLIRIYKKIQNQFPELCLVLIGEGPLRKQVEEQIPNSVISLGSRTDVQSILLQAQALLLPSLIEGLPGVILEAMTAKVPVIAYDVGGISEVIENGKTGYLIPKREEELFAEIVINQILNGSQNDLRGILDQAFHQVENHFSLDSVSGKFESFYFSLINPIYANTDS